MTRLLVILICLLLPAIGRAAERDAAAVARAIDQLLESHWKQHDLRPAPAADDLTLFRRVTLDLAGRVPTAAEVRAFNADRSPERYTAAVRRLVEGPEFAYYFATVLDEVIQGRYAGNEAFVNYLREALRSGRGWDTVFRDVLLGPWDTAEKKAASLFLDRRAKDLDVLTVDATRAFFGVDISCARCHNHPLVDDWKQDHYYGMAAFLNRTTGGKGQVGEKTEGEVKFLTRGGKEKTAAMMFLSGRQVEEPAASKAGPKFSRREQLVRVALEEPAFLSRALVNRLWEYFLGRGLVQPVDQMHSGNPASVPAVLDELARDFAASGYDITRLATALVLSRAYRLEGRGSTAEPQHFAAARLRPLSPRQLATALVLALGPETPDPAASRPALDKQAAELLTALDPRTADFQSSTREALFVSNSPVVQKLLIAADGNLTDRLARITDNRALVQAAYLALFSRPPTDAETAELVGFLRQSGGRSTAVADLAWALAASAEFRFNH